MDQTASQRKSSAAACELFFPSFCLQTCFSEETNQKIKERGGRSTSRSLPRQEPSSSTPLRQQVFPRDLSPTLRSTGLGALAHPAFFSIFLILHVLTTVQMRRGWHKASDAKIPKPNVY